MKIKILVVALVSMMFSLQPASASLSDCGDNRLCIFHDANYSGTMYSYLPQQEGNWINLSLSRQDKMTSWVNNTSMDVLFAEHTYGSGTQVCANSESVDGNVESFNDLLSSFRFMFSANFCS